MHRLKTVLLAIGLGLSAIGIQSIVDHTALAETIVIKNTDQFYSENKPYRGMRKEQVRQHFGEPRRTYSAVGDPPISRWQYDDFTVYFEKDRVIHAVDNYTSRTTN